MRFFFTLFLLLPITALAQAKNTPNWLRYPSISPDGKTIAFVYKGNIYSIPSKGGTAKQLTTHKAYDFHPVWSHDGKTIAFATARHGNFDIYTMNVNGEEVKRLTYHSNDEIPYTFSADDQSVIFGGVRMDLSAHRQYPTASQPELYQVPAQGGRVTQIFTVPGEEAQVNRSGTRIFYHDKKGGENAYRKHHQSSITRDLWSYDTKTNTHSMITRTKWENRQPILDKNEQSLYYLSEESGSFNIHKIALDHPDQDQQLTHFKELPIRFLSYGGGLLCFGFDGEIYTMREGSTPQKVQVELYDLAQENPKEIITVDKNIQEMSISPDGNEIAFIAGGEVFVTDKEGDYTKRITNTAEQERFVTFSPDGKRLLYSSERKGKWEIYQSVKKRESEPFFYASTLLEEKPLAHEDQESYLPKIAPDGAKMAYIANRRNLRIMDLKTGATKDILSPDSLIENDVVHHQLSWSPDSNWLLLEWKSTLSNSEILLLAADGSKRQNLTQSGYEDRRPKWVNQGKQMLWFTNKNGYRSFAMSGGSEKDVYSLFFTQKAHDTFKWTEKEYQLHQKIEELAKVEGQSALQEKVNGKGESTPQLSIDWESLEDRKERLTPQSGRLSDAVLSKDGEKLYFLSASQDGLNLWETQLRTKETKIKIRLGKKRGGSLQWDFKKEALYALIDGQISTLDLEKEERKILPINGEIEYDKLKTYQYQLEHVYQRTKHIFYEPTFHHNNWDELYQTYKKYLPSIGNNYEFSDLLSEFLGELNVSHSGARYAGEDLKNKDETAALGIFMDNQYKGEGIKITEVIKGGPLDKAEFDIEPGMIITKIDGEPLTTAVDVAHFLNRKAGGFILLEVSGRQPSQIRVKPITLAEENALLYKRFVRINAKEVERLSKGRLGYVHIPGMADGPFRNVYEEMMGKYADKEGVLIDTRFNSGGDLVSDLAMFLTGEQFLTYATAEKEVGKEPYWRYLKPTVLLFNESNYSDGHCFAQAYTDLKIGKTVGMPVPGTCSWSGWETLSKGLRWGVVPVGVKNKSGQWMENNPTLPSFQVKNDPNVISKGQDEQLEKAVAELLSQLDA